MSTIQPRTATVTIYQGDYLDRLRFLERKFEVQVEAEKSGPPRIQSEIPESHRLVAEHTALKAEADEKAVSITVHGLGRRAYRKVVDAHPPRDGDEGDVHLDTFKDALIEACADFSGFTEADIDNISDGDWNNIYLTALGLNRTAGLAPKGLNLPIKRESGETSN